MLVQLANKNNEKTELSQTAGKLTPSPAATSLLGGQLVINISSLISHTLCHMKLQHFVK